MKRATTLTVTLLFTGSSAPSSSGLYIVLSPNPDLTFSSIIPNSRSSRWRFCYEKAAFHCGACGPVDAAAGGAAKRPRWYMENGHEQDRFSQGARRLPIAGWHV